MSATATLPERLFSRFAGSHIGEVPVGRVVEAFESGEHALNRQGTSSQLLVKLLEAHDENWTREAALKISPIAEEFKYVSSKPELKTQYYNQIAKGKLATDPAVASAAFKHSNLMASEYHAVASIPGTKVGKPVDGPYWPRMYDRKYFSGRNRQKAIDYLVNSGQAKNYDHAASILDSRDKFNPYFPKFHHIESDRRLLLPFPHREDPAVVLDYLVGAERLRSRIKYFGQNAEKLRPVLSAIRRESGEGAYQYAKNITSTFLGGNVDAFGGELEGAVRSYQTITKMGLAFISHTLQPLNAALVVGVKPMVKALFEAASEHDSYAAFAMRSGAALQDTIHDIRRIAGSELVGLAQKLPHMRAFTIYDEIRRNLVSNVGKHAALDEFSKLLENPTNRGARLRLASLGINIDDALARGALSESELERAGLKLSNLTQFQRNALVLPPLWNANPLTRLLTQYKPFFFTQARFIKDNVILPALRDGDFRPLMYMAVLFPTFGELAADIKTWARGRSVDERPSWEDYPYDRVVSNVSQVGAFGVVADVTSAMTSSSPTATYQFLTGPTVSDIAETIHLPFAKRATQERALLRRIPSLGPALSEYAVPVKHKKSFLEAGGITKTIHEITGEE